MIPACPRTTDAPCAICGGSGAAVIRSAPTTPCCPACRDAAGRLAVALGRLIAHEAGAVGRRSGWAAPRGEGDPIGRRPTTVGGSVRADR